MDLIKQIKEFSAITDFVETNNFYFTHHICSKSGQDIKVELDYTLSTDHSDQILKLGVCKACGICFYHKDFLTTTF